MTAAHTHESLNGSVVPVVNRYGAVQPTYTDPAELKTQTSMDTPDDLSFKLIIYDERRTTHFKNPV